MNAIIPLIPDNAPFSPTQRAWLNGFLAGLYGNAATCAPAAAAPAVEPAEDLYQSAYRLTHVHSR
jgi:sulfite reductase (NADPH) flavoprotein alpha-component